MLNNTVYYGNRGQRKFPRILLFACLFTLLLIIVLGFGFFYYNASAPNEVFILSPISRITNEVIYSRNLKKNNRNLKAIIENILGEDMGQYGIVVENLKSGIRYYFNEDKSYNTASLYKLWVMADVYQQIEEGKLTKDLVLTKDVSYLNERFNLASESAELNEGTISLSVHDALNKMITISDNYASHLLVDAIGVSSLANFLDKYNFFESKAGTLEQNPISSAKDIASFFKKLYRGELANEVDTIEMLDLLKGQQVNTKLSKDLPENVVIAHKTGELSGLSHDAGIVYSPKGDYIIVVMSKTENPPVANENIAEISNEVYDYFAD